MSLLEVLLSGETKTLSLKVSPASPASPDGGDAGDAGEDFLKRDFNFTKGTGTKAKGRNVVWPAEPLDAESRFGRPHARLFPFIGRKVRTPAGPGTLLQVFADRATVVLDSELSRCAFFRPAEIEPASSELP